MRLWESTVGPTGLMLDRMLNMLQESPRILRKILLPAFYGLAVASPLNAQPGQL
jgi:hypothetical protein